MGDQERVEKLLSQAIGGLRTAAGKLENREPPIEALRAATKAARFIEDALDEENR